MALGSQRGPRQFKGPRSLVCPPPTRKCLPQPLPTPQVHSSPNVIKGRFGERLMELKDSAMTAVYPTCRLGWSWEGGGGVWLLKTILSLQRPQYTNRKQWRRHIPTVPQLLLSPCWKRSIDIKAYADRYHTKGESDRHRCHTYRATAMGTIYCYRWRAMTTLQILHTGNAL